MPDISSLSDGISANVSCSLLLLVVIEVSLSGVEVSASFVRNWLNGSPCPVLVPLTSPILVIYNNCINTIIY